MQLFRHLLGFVMGLALMALMVIPVTAAVISSAEEDTPHGSVTAGLARDLTTPAANVPQRCHGGGALIRSHGRIRQVTLARGLQTYEHRAPGTFIGLCPVTPTPQGS